MRGWEELGWVTVEGVLTADELVLLQEECERLSQLPLDGDDDVRRRVTGSPTRSDRLDPVIDLSPAFAALAEDPRVRKLATDVLDRDVELLKDKLILKPPGAPGYVLHQDHAYMPDGGPAADEICVVVLALAAVTADAGPIELVPGHHTTLLTPEGVPADLDLCALGGTEPVPVALGAGDALVMHHLAPHRSGPNRSAAGRPTLLFTYVAHRHGRWREWYYDATRRRLGETV